MKRLLLAFRSGVRGLLVAYFITVAGVAGVCGTASYYLNKHERLPLLSKDPSFPLDLRFIVKIGLYNELVSHNLEVANEHYMVFLRYINREWGLKFEKDSEVLSEYPSNEQIFAQGKAWYDVYADVLMRCAIIKGQRGYLDGARSLLEKAVSFIEYAKQQGDSDCGNVTLRNRANRLLAKVYTLEGKKPVLIENLLVDSITTVYEQYPKVFQQAKIERFDDMLYLSNENMAIMSRDLYDSIEELLTHYAKNKEGKKCFNIYLSNLKFLESYKEPDKNFEVPSLADLMDQYLFFNEMNDKPAFTLQHGDIPLLKLHIAELLWSFKQQQPAINWTKSAFAESFNYSRREQRSSIVAKLSIETLKSMYEALNKNGQYLEKIERCKEASENIFLPSYSSSFKMIWDNRM